MAGRFLAEDFFEALYFWSEGAVIIIFSVVTRFFAVRVLFVVDVDAYI